MNPVPTAATSALTELLEVSPQVDVAVILERDGGRLLASAPTSSERVAASFGTICTKVLDAAERSRTELGREPIAQVEIATPDGHMFVVADAHWIVAAVTSADPTVGLVFYDLKTALRTVREAGAAAASAGNGSNGSTGSNGATAPLVSARTTDEQPADSAAGQGDADSSAATSDDTSSSSSNPSPNRWRRKKS